VPAALVIPALDEEDALGEVLAAVDRSLVRDVIVGDNGSRDRTAEVARAGGAIVVHVAERGYGAACAGALSALAPDIDLVVFMDADGSDDPTEMERLSGPITAGHADLVIGSRALGIVEPGALTPQQRFGNWVATRLVRLLYGHYYTDLGPFRAARYDALAGLDLREETYGWPVEMIVKGARRGLRIAEVPVSYHPRIGSSKISGTLRGSVGAAWCILAGIVKYRFADGVAGGARPHERA